MPILIDGHNVIGQSAELTLSDPDDEAKLVQRLRVYRSVVNQPLIVIFDRGGSYGHPYQLSGGGVEVVFAGVGCSADQLIIARITHCPAPEDWLVVSSDQEIQSAARTCGARVMNARDFTAEMAKTHGPKRKKPRRISPEPNLSKREVNEWLALFGRSGPPKR